MVLASLIVVQYPEPNILINYLSNYVDRFFVGYLFD